MRLAYCLPTGCRTEKLVHFQVVKFSILDVFGGDRQMLDKPLVTQYLEGISGSALDKYQKVIREYVKRRHGIYALYRRDRLYYVGLATN